MTELEGVGLLIAKKMHEQDVSVFWLADKLNISHWALVDILKGRLILSYPRLIKVGQLLHLDVNDLLDESRELAARTNTDDSYVNELLELLALLDAEF